MILFNVEGMTCGHCVRAVTKAIQRLDPHAHVQVNVSEGTVAINESRLEAYTLAEAIKDTGYEVRNIERE